MLLSLLRLAARRTDIRPFHKRIFTESVLDKIYSTSVTVLIGGALCMTSVAMVNIIMYYKVVKPVREQERERLEKDLIEADEAGLERDEMNAADLLYGLIFENFKILMFSRGKRFMRLVGPDVIYWFPACILIGAAFELFKIKFTFMGVNYYTVFRKKQMQQQLEDLENWLKQIDELSARAVQSEIEARKKK
uniref:Calcium uniporter protein n=1 Tax=Setaria digitata TaxID=48799 RepID=A0A915PW93_9BILA